MNSPASRARPSSRKTQSRRPRKATRAPAVARGYVEPVLSEEQRERKAFLLSRFRNFAQAWQGKFYHAQPHDEMCDELEACVPLIGTGRRQKKKVYQAPRYTYKTNLAQALTVFVFLKYRDLDIDASVDYMRATADEAESFLYEIKQRLQTEEWILELWGDLSQAANLWSARRINLGNRRDPTVAVLGLDKGTAGKHPDLVICDDLVNEKNFDSIKAKRAARNKIQAYYAVLPPHGSLVVVGTRFAHNDVYGWIEDTERSAKQRHEEMLALGKTEEASKIQPQYTFYVRSWRNDGVLFAPDILSEEFIEQQRQSLEARWFAAWYENKPFVEGMIRFKEDYLRYFSAHFSRWPFPTLELIVEHGGLITTTKAFPVNVTMTIDPTVTALGTSDRTGMSVVCTDSAEQWWVMMAQSYLEVPSRIGEIALELVRKYEPQRLRIESSMADVDMVSRIQRGILEEGLKTAIESYHPVRDEEGGMRGRPGRRKKFARIEALEPRFRAGKILFHRGRCGHLYEQYRHWPDIDHDDVFDSLAMHYGLARKCEFDSIDDLERRDLDAEDRESPGDMMRGMTAEVRLRGGGTLKIGIPTKPGDPDRRIGWAGVTSQRLKVS